MSKRPTYKLEDVPLIHQRQRQGAAAFKAVVANAVLQSDFDQWLTLGDATMQTLALFTKGRAVDIPTDRAWGGLKRVLDGFVRLYTPDPAVPATEEESSRYALAVSLDRVMIGDSLLFLQRDLMSQWREMDQRLRRLDTPMSAGQTPRQAFATLGLTHIVERLETLQVAYTKAVGLDSPQRAEALQKWEDALASLEGGISYLIKDPAQRDAALAALAAPFIETVNARRDREAKAKKSNTQPDSPPAGASSPPAAP
jgi:hypothetical protein